MQKNNLQYLNKHINNSQKKDNLLIIGQPLVEKNIVSLSRYKEYIDLILPTSSNEIITISKNSHFFDSIGVELFMSDHESIMICSDKLKFYQKCKSKFPLPTTDYGYNSGYLPLFAKPSKTETTKTNITSTWYSAFKNAIAPSAILFPIFFIRSVPSF